MANTTTKGGGRFISIVPDGSTDWNIATDMSDYQYTGMRVRSITFHGTAKNDVLIVNDGSNAGPELFRYKFISSAEAYTYSQQYCGKPIFPYIDASDCTFASASNTRILMELE